MITSAAGRPRFNRIAIHRSFRPARDHAIRRKLCRIPGILIRDLRISSTHLLGRHILAAISSISNLRPGIVTMQTLPLRSSSFAGTALRPKGTSPARAITRTIVARSAASGDGLQLSSSDRLWEIGGRYWVRSFALQIACYRLKPGPSYIS